jgi:hypothetical protein
VQKGTDQEEGARYIERVKDMRALLQEMHLEEILAIHLLFIEAPSHDVSKTDEFTQARWLIFRRSPARFFKMGQLMAEHPNPKVRQATYLLLSEFLEEGGDEDEYRAAKHIIFDTLLHDNDPKVVRFLYEQLEGHTALDDWFAAQWTELESS